MTSSDFLIDFLTMIKRELEGEYRLDIEKKSDLDVYLVNLSVLRLRLPPDTPFIMVTKGDLERFSSQALFAVVAQEINLRQTLPGSVVVLVDTEGDALSELRAEPHWAIVLNRSTIQAIEQHDNPKRALQEAFRNQVELRFLSPYEPNQPVVGSQFYGRDTEKNLILTHHKNSFAIFGGRKIGKTSLLREVRRNMLEKYLTREQTKRVFWYDFWGYQGEEYFFEELVRHFGEGYPRLVRQDFASYFPRFIKVMKSVYGGPIIFFLDEVDDLISIEQKTNFHLLGLLKRIALSGDGQLLMAGFRLLSEELKRYGTSLNFLRPLPLTNLNRDATLSMLRDPMSSMGITIEPGVFPQILADTGGHPQLVQLYCQSLVELLDKTNERVITMNHIRTVKQVGRLYDTLVDMLIANTSDLEFALVYSLAEHEEFDLTLIDSILTGHGIHFKIKQLREITQSLEVTGIISRRGHAENFQFAIPLQPALARKAVREAFVWKKAIETVNQQERVP